MKTGDTILYWSNKAYGKETPFKIAAVLMKEAFDVMNEQLRLDDYPSEQVVRKVNIDTAVGDVLAMTQLYCSMTDRDFSQLYMDGCQRAIERCKEKLSGCGGF